MSYASSDTSAEFSEFFAVAQQTQRFFKSFQPLKNTLTCHPQSYENPLKPVGANSLTTTTGKNDKGEYDTFVKVQINEATDPITNEIITLRVFNTKRIGFAIPMYKNHYLVNLSSPINPVCYPALEMDNVTITKQAESFGDRIIQLRNVIKQHPIGRRALSAVPDINVLRIQMNEFIQNYMTFAVPINFSHNDLHVNNIVFNKADHLTLIDFGRCFCDLQGVFSNEQLVALADDFKKFNLQIPKTNGVIDINALYVRRYQTTDYGCLCDIAALALYFTIFTPFQYNQFCTVDLLAQPQSATFDYTTGNTCKDWIDVGLLWFCCYIYAVHSAHLNTFDLTKQLTLHWPGVRDSLIETNYAIHPDVYYLKGDRIPNATFKLFIDKLDRLLDDEYNKDGKKIVKDVNKELITNILTLLSTKYSFNGGKSDGNRSTMFNKDTKKQPRNHLQKGGMITEPVDEWFEMVEKQPTVKSINTAFMEEFVSFHGPKITKDTPYDEKLMQSYNKERRTQTIQKLNSIFGVPPTSMRAGPGADYKDLKVVGPPFSVPYVSVTSGPGGSSNKVHKVYTDPNTKRKYIRKSSQKWFLNEHRGMYRYVDKEKTKITLTKSAK